MANLRSSKKDIRRTERRKERNSQDRTEIRTYARGLLKAIKSGNKEEALGFFSKYASKIDRAAKTNLIHKKNADRKKARMAAKINLLAKPASA
ncbi:MULTISPECIES: 30S ribosomal protein S20 [Leptospira]|uniref:Small ribosomal subunit protein bS20 n=2 Tax=Leptospira TaxID=171 RepID=A0A4R9LNN4_9LEPT|nr:MULTISPECIES: 30S ribosomal protein S20 [Leptospira]TGN06831.1 30S ribosomal protein S20 [Leptospira ilyithenensis]BDA80116.1 30S ribosomal protein S20 [Leptospira kobayashii]